MQQEPHWRHEKTMIVYIILEGTGKKCDHLPGQRKIQIFLATGDLVLISGIS
jgi:hypothetical protein